ncbi:exodeoxyribonuclease I [Dokdonella sp.]|uniref:exodeoxyribonuclease I n=1 Tax=Dokdonella sp. TaxID=2291710 RepID=UPI003529B1C9
MASTTFFWHDYETSGIDPRRDRPVQFAGMRTSVDLEIVGEPVMLYCKPARDLLPHPEACLVTGIVPQQAEREGLIEAEFAAIVHEELAAPGTCGVGYNSLRFDDEFTRNLLYRNFHDPYEREWRAGNSRWDLIDLVRMCYALRPHGIEWPLHEEGSPSFRLEDLASANQLKQNRAHDALSDVEATIDLARLIRRQQPRLFDFHFDMRRKQRAFQLLDFAHRTPIVHVSSRYPATRGCLAIVAPLAAHPQQSNAVIVYDLDIDPRPMLELEPEEIADRVFVSNADLPEDVERIPLKLVHANRSPALAPMSVLKGIDSKRIGLDSERALRNLGYLNAAEGLAARVQAVFEAQAPFDPAADPELALYSGFLPDADKPLLRKVRQTPGELLGDSGIRFRDPRYAELLFRYRARNWPQSLSDEESAKWLQFRCRRLNTESALTGLTLEQFFQVIGEKRNDVSADKLPLLDALEDWGRELQREIQ